MHSSPVVLTLAGQCAESHSSDANAVGVSGSATNGRQRTTYQSTSRQPEAISSRSYCGLNVLSMLDAPCSSLLIPTPGQESRKDRFRRLLKQERLTIDSSQRNWYENKCRERRSSKLFNDFLMTLKGIKVPNLNS